MTTADTRRHHTMVGTWSLLRLALRRERVATTVWVLAIGLTVLSTALTLPELFTDPAERAARLQLMANPAAIAFGGPLHTVDDYTFGAMMTNEMLGFAAVFGALMSLLIVVRHTRTEEETGRTELVRANVVGRHAQLTAALLMAVIANVVLALIVALGLGAAGIESITWSGSWLFASAMAMVGIVFAGVAAVTAQINEHGRGANGMAGLLLGLAFTLRVAGDIGQNFLSWLSPIGWAHRTYAYVDDRWWPLLLGVGLTAVLVAAAIKLENRRDVGAGLRAPKTGASHASPALATPQALALRLQRTPLIAWVVSMFTFGAVFGLLLADIEGFAAEMTAIEDLLGEVEAALIDAYIGLMAMMMAMAAAVFAVGAMLRSRTEELTGRAEPVLAAAVSRHRWMASHAVVALGGGTLIAVAGAVGLGATGAATLGDASVVGATVSTTLVYMVGTVFMAGLAATLFGLWPKVTFIAWAFLAYSLTAGFLGGLLGLPEWAMDLTIYRVLPMVNAQAFTPGPVALIAAIGAGLLAVGFVAFRRRDLTTTA